MARDADGFRPIFNGKTLAGWRAAPRHNAPTSVGDPWPSRDTDEWRRADTHTGKWTVEEGAIVGRQDPPGSGSDGRAGRRQSGTSDVHGQDRRDAGEVRVAREERVPGFGSGQRDQEVDESRLGAAAGEREAGLRYPRPGIRGIGQDVDALEGRP